MNQYLVLVVAVLVGLIIGMFTRVRWLRHRIEDLRAVQTRQTDAIVDLERRCETSEHELIDLVRAKGNQVALLLSLRRIEKRLGMPQTQLTVSWRPKPNAEGGMVS